MNKFIRKIFSHFKKCFFPRKHSKIVRDIKLMQLQVKLIQKRLGEINHLSEYGLIGDRLLDEQIWLIDMEELYKKEVFCLKEKYKKEYDNKKIQ